jgi:hypothetical protein
MNQDLLMLLDKLTPERRVIIEKLRSIILENLPLGFAETISYGMISFVVPKSIYPLGYHCNPSQPLPFISIASQKAHFALYHLGLYANSEILEWFKIEFEKDSSRKLDLGKGCLRFKVGIDIPYSLIGQLCNKISMEQWIEYYERNIKQSKKE